MFLNWTKVDFRVSDRNIIPSRTQTDPMCMLQFPLPDVISLRYSNKSSLLTYEELLFFNMQYIEVSAEYSRSAIFLASKIMDLTRV